VYFPALPPPTMPMRICPTASGAPGLTISRTSNLGCGIAAVDALDLSLFGTMSYNRAVAGGGNYVLDFAAGQILANCSACT